MKLYSYVVARDFGFAPNPFFNMCTLAACKPMIRKMASVGDWVIGTGSKEKGLQGHLVYAMQVNEIVSFQNYWEQDRFRLKRPQLGVPGKMYGYGDNIYHRGDDGGWIQENSHHSFPGGVQNADNITRDTSTTDSVLVSYFYTYFGKSGPRLPAEIQSVVCPGRGYRCEFPEALITECLEWIAGLPRGVQGIPAEF